jgi:hypothetical protein
MWKIYHPARAQDNIQPEGYLQRGTAIGDFWELTGTLLFCRYLAREEASNGWWLYIAEESLYVPCSINSRKSMLSRYWLVNA